ncbi:C39 family peptidase [Kitasatospora sp. A2-31]|uniref:C39 family peptidase n=1 Tax=Kitasatospora sp. A2-31 TaxID=2916414 RepID=UPI001EEF324E|nr:C39 family peptidase [Kitasatospora sp. A2-31]MCG6499366.1 C39 family peptidase [Kitasatospora sp. A2-31]
MPDHPKRHPIPLITQYATPGLINAIAYEGHPPGDDDNWATTGAPDKETYAYWSTRLCGMACLRMALFARDGHAPTLFDLLDGCLAYGGYVQQEDGGVGGLYYQPFTEYALARHGLKTEIITDLAPDRLLAELDLGHLVMASVHKEIRRPDRPAPARGGHLVLVTGHQDGEVSFRNPSGHTADSADAVLPLDRFDTFAAHRGIAMWV